MMKTLYLILIGWPLFAIVTSGCAPLHQVRRDRLSKVHRVAIVGFTLEQEQTNRIEITVGPDGSSVKAKRDEWDPLRISPLKEARREQALTPSDHALHMYDRLRSEIASRLGWQVLSAANIEDIVQKANSNTGFFSVSQPPPFPADRYSALQLPGFYLLSSLSDDQRNELMEKLNIQALIGLHIRVRLNRTDQLSLGRVDLGTYRPSAIVQLVCYEKGFNEPIWLDRQAAGKEVESTTKHVSGVAENSEINRLAIEATNRAFLSLFNRLNLASN